MSRFADRTSLTSPVITHTPRVFVADVDQPRCEMLATAVRRNRMRAVGRATKSTDVVIGASYSEPDACLIALRLADGQRAGLRALLPLQAICPRTRSIILVDSSDAPVVVDALREGASGVLCREEVLSRLGKCIRCVLAGEIWANSSQVEFLIEDLRVRHRVSYPNYEQRRID